MEKCGTKWHTNKFPKPQPAEKKGKKVAHGVLLFVVSYIKIQNKL